MKSGKELIDLIQAQIGLEKNTTKQIEKLEKATANLAAKLFLAEMRFDTEKHSRILETMIELMSHVKPDTADRRFWQVETQRHVDALIVKSMIENHVKVETKMLKQTEAAMAKTEDEALTLLLTQIKEDEKIKKNQSEP